MRRIVTLLPLVVVACGGEDESALEQAAVKVCERLAQCQGVTLDDSTRELCVSLYGASLQILPDPTAFERCIDGLSCDAINKDKEAVTRCVALDVKSISCHGDDLYACSTGGVCRLIDCRQVCGVLSASFDHCGMSADKGHDVCWCRR